MLLTLYSTYIHCAFSGDLADAIKAKSDMHFGIYHSLYEWFNPLYLQDKEAQFQTNKFVTSKTMPELRELVSLNYY